MRVIVTPLKLNLAILLLLPVLVPVFVRSIASDASITADPLSGTEWQGVLHHGNDSKAIGMRFDIDRNGATILFLDIPEMKFRNLGPIHVHKDGDTYIAADLKFNFTPNRKILIGVEAYDGNSLEFQLTPGALPPAPPQVPATIPMVQPVWTFKTGGAIWSSPVTSGRLIYVGSTDGNVYALDAKSGALVWRFGTKGPVMGRPTVDGRYIYTLSDDGLLYKLGKEDGQSVWQFDTHGGSVARNLPSTQSDTYDYLASAATVSGGVVYIGSADKRLYAIDASTGHEKWHFETQGIVRTTPAVARGLVFFGSYDHNVYAVKAETGELVWKLDTLREVVSAPVVADDTVYVGSRNSNLYALAADTGVAKWKYFYWSSWVESSALIRDDSLYIGSSDYQQLFAINRINGKEIWRFNTDGSAWGTPAVTDKKVYIGAVGVVGYFIDHHGGFYAVDRATGRAVWRYLMSAMPGEFTYGFASSPTVDQGRVFVGGLDGKLYAFREGD